MRGHLQQLIEPVAAAQVDRLVQPDRELTIVCKPSVRSTIFVGMLPGLSDNERIPRHGILLDEARVLP